MCATLLQSHYLCEILCPPHVSYHELVSMPANSHHKLAFVLDVLILRMLHVLQMCDSHKRQTNSQRYVPCDTISRSPIFMRLPDASHTNAVQTETHLNGSSVLP